LFFAFAVCFLSPLSGSAQSPTKPDSPPADEIWYHSVTQDSNGEIRLLHGDAKLETNDFSLSADEIQFNSDTNWVHAQGHVHLEHFATGDKLNADHGDYNIKTQEGKFFGVKGTAPAKVITSPGILTTSNPFYFQAQWAERIKDRYVLHHGFLTDCKMPKPWWIFEAPVFDVIPADRAIAKRAVFRLHGIPLFYLPVFYRPLGRNPRQSGFLTPNIGHSSFYGFVFGEGFYWAINRSYDMSIIGQDFSSRGPALRYDFRGKPNEASDFNFNFYGVDDIKGTANGSSEKQGGEEFELTGSTSFHGFTGRLDYNYLSSFLFREAFSYSFATTISSQNNSVGFLQRHFKNDRYTFNIAMARTELYEEITQLNQTPNRVVLQQLPDFEFLGRDQQIVKGVVPLWFSFDASAGALSREEPTGTFTLTTNPPLETFRSGPYSRVDAQPRVSTEFNWKGFSLNPSISFGATDYSNYYAVNSTTYTPITNCGGYPTCTPNPSTNVALRYGNLFRRDADFVADLRPPVLERVFVPPKWLHLTGKFKHVIETEATYEYVTGIDNFQKIIHFDATDILSDTNQLTLSMTNRLYRKDKNGNVSEVLTWRVAHARYFDPTFGGAVRDNERNIVLSAVELTPIAFLNGPRNYSPIVSTLSLNPYPFFSIDWRTNYDPLSKRFLDQSYGVNLRHGKYFGGVSDTAIKTDPLLIPQNNQIAFGGGYGSANRTGWNFSGNVFYDLLLGRRLFDFVNASYNTNCCGFSFQLRNFNLGIRQENQYLFSFQVANIGSFGSLQKQNRNF
jgi:LPS-assembly protein